MLFSNLLIIREVYLTLLNLLIVQISIKNYCWCARLKIFKRLSKKKKEKKNKYIDTQYDAFASYRYIYEIFSKFFCVLLRIDSSSQE